MVFLKHPPGGDYGWQIIERLPLGTTGTSQDSSRLFARTTLRRSRRQSALSVVATLSFGVATVWLSGLRRSQVSRELF
jgi:hypothetical protein